MKLPFARGALSLCALIAGIALQAAPVTWTVNMNAPGAGMSYGTFTYNADTDELLNWDFPWAFSPELSGTLSFSRALSNSFLDFDGGSDTPVDVSVGLYLQLAAPLTDAGGIIQLIPTNMDVPGTSVVDLTFCDYGCSYSVVPILSGTVSAAPEPGSSFYIGLVFLAVVIESGRRMPRRA